MAKSNKAVAKDMDHAVKMKQQPKFNGIKRNATMNECVLNSI